MDCLRDILHVSTTIGFLFSRQKGKVQIKDGSRINSVGDAIQRMTDQVEQDSDQVDQDTDPVGQ